MSVYGPNYAYAGAGEGAAGTKGKAGVRDGPVDGGYSLVALVDVGVG